MQAAWEESVERAEIHVLGNRTSFFVIRVVLVLCLFGRNTEDDGGRARMDISAVAVGFHHDGVSAVVGSNSKLDLRKIKVEEAAALGSYDKLPDTNGVITLAGHILKVGLAGCKPAGVRSHRQELGVYATGRGIDPFGIPIDICAFEL